MRIIAGVIFIFCLSLSSFAQEQKTQQEGAELDSLRKKEEGGTDTIVPTARYIRYTNVRLLKDSTHTLPIDTTILNFHNYNPIYQPERPTIGLGNLGLAHRDLLFNPEKTIGFDPGFHSLDLYLLRSDSIKYYRARAPYTELYYINGSLNEQLLKITHSQNIKPNWNFGANYNRIGAEGFYKNQQSDHLSAAVFSWFESPNKRYNVLAHGVFNTLKATENGSTVEDSVFDIKLKTAAEVRFNQEGEERPRQTWRQNTLFLKQIYYIGRIDSLNADCTLSNILPTQRVSHALSYSKNMYGFYRNEFDQFEALPHPQKDSIQQTNDNTELRNLRNEFFYSFYLRGRSVSFIKNELKLDVGLQHDLYSYNQNDSIPLKFQNTALRAGIGYSFSDKINIEGDIHQIFQGRNIGDYLYDARTNFKLSRSVGRIVLGAYLQNKSPEQLFERSFYQYHPWSRDFKNTKINNLSFLYDNPKFRLKAKAEYFLIGNYLYYRETSISRQIEPVQADKNISLLKLSIGKQSTFGKFTLENYIVYQKSNFQDLLRTPEIYNYTSFYYGTQLLRVLTTNIGFDVRYNTPFNAPSYSINTGQFYNGASVEFPTYPVVDVWIRATLRRADLFLKYDYASQGLFSNGYYTVNKYPMGDALLKFGVRWKFYD